MSCGRSLWSVKPDKVRARMVGAYEGCLASCDVPCSRRNCADGCIACAGSSPLADLQTGRAIEQALKELCMKPFRGSYAVLAAVSSAAVLALAVGVPGQAATPGWRASLSPPYARA